MPGGNPCFTGTDEPGKASLWGREPCEGYAEHIDGLSRPRLRPLREASGASGGVLTLPLAGERTRAERSGPSGSATHTGLHAQARVAVRLTLPLDVERTETVRLGPSGSATHTGLHAQGRVAVRLTLPLGGERTWQCHPHCHSRVNVRGWNVHARVAVPPTRGGTFRPEWQCRSR